MLELSELSKIVTESNVKDYMIPIGFISVYDMLFLSVYYQ